MRLQVKGEVSKEAKERAESISKLLDSTDGIEIVKKSYLDAEMFIKELDKKRAVPPHKMKEAMVY